MQKLLYMLKGYNLKSLYLKSIITLSTGSIVVMILRVLSGPVITRLFTVEQLGVNAYILSITHLFMGVVNGRYDMSIITEKNEENLIPLIKLALLIGLISTTLISVVLGIYLKLSNSYDQYPYLIVFFFFILFSYGVINVFTALNNRDKKYNLLATVNIFRGASQSVGPILFGFLNTGVFGLLLSYAIGQVLGIYKLLMPLKSRLQRIKNAKVNDIIKVAKIHKKQPIYSTPALFANSFSYSSITIFLEALFGVTVVGYYSITNTVLGIPLAVISGNVARVFFEEASREYDQTGAFLRAFKKTATLLILLAIPMVIIMMLFSPWAFGIVFGKDWAVAGSYARILAPLLGFRFIVSPLTPGLIIANKQKFELGLQVLFLLASVIPLLMALIFSLPTQHFLLMISILKSTVFMLYFFAIYKYSK